MEYQDSVRPFPFGGSHSTHACTLRTCIHKFSPASLLTSPSGSQDGTPVAITALSQSPAIDVIGIGFASGEISVYDIRMDERLLRMKMQDGAVRALSFRSGMSKVVFTRAESSQQLSRWSSYTRDGVFERTHRSLGSQCRRKITPYCARCPRWCYIRSTMGSRSTSAHLLWRRQQCKSEWCPLLMLSVR